LRTNKLNFVAEKNNKKLKSF